MLQQERKSRGAVGPLRLRQATLPLLSLAAWVYCSAQAVRTGHYSAACQPVSNNPSLLLSHCPSQEPALCARVEATLARAKRDFWWRI